MFLVRMWNESQRLSFLSLALGATHTIHIDFSSFVNAVGEEMVAFCDIQITYMSCTLSLRVCKVMSSGL